MWLTPPPDPSSISVQGQRLAAVTQENLTSAELLVERRQIRETLHERSVGPAVRRKDRPSPGTAIGTGVPPYARRSAKPQKPFEASTHDARRAGERYRNADGKSSTFPTMRVERQIEHATCTKE